MAKKVSKNSLLVIAEVFYPEEFLINELAFKWAKEGKNIEVLTRNPSYPYGKIYAGYKNSLHNTKVEEGIKITRYHSLEGYKESVLIKIVNILWNMIISTIIAVFKFKKHDNIFIYHTGPLTTAFAGVVLKKLYGAKLTIWTQDLWPDAIYAYGFGKSKVVKAILGYYVGFIYNNVDKIIVSSPAFKAPIKEFTDKEISFIPNWAASLFDNQNYSSDSCHTTRFVFAGNIGKAQNLYTVIKAFDKWQSASDKNAVFNIYGDGSALDELKELVNKDQIDSVKLHGRVPLKDMPQIYKENDIMLLSLKEDKLYDLYIPAKFPVYLMTKKPIFAITNGIVSDLVSDNNCGAIAAPDDIDQIVLGFEHLYLLDEGQRKEIAVNADKLSDLLFSKEAIVDNIETILFKP